MKTTKLEERGRILIPKEIRERIGLHTGERLRISVENNTITIRPERMNSLHQLRGCIQGSSIKPLEVKRIWNA